MNFLWFMTKKKNILRPRNKLAMVDYLGYEARYLFLSR